MVREIKESKIRIAINEFARESWVLVETMEDEPGVNLLELLTRFASTEQR